MVITLPTINLDKEKAKDEIEDITKFIAQNVRKKGLISLSVVGSFSDPEHKAEVVNDLDVLYIYEDYDPTIKKPRITEGIYQDVKKLYQKIENEFSSGILDIVECERCGPFKPIPKKKPILEIHHILYTVNRWMREEPTFLLDRAKRFKKFEDSRLDELLEPGDIYRINKISKYCVIRDFYGINHSLAMIKDKVITYCVWRKDPRVLRTRTVKSTYADISDHKNPEIQRALVELLCYSVIKCGLNAKRVYNSDFCEILRIEYEQYEDVFKDFEFKETFQKARDIKNQLRQSEFDMALDEIKKFEEEVVKYLLELRKWLETK